MFVQVEISYRHVPGLYSHLKIPGIAEAALAVAKIYFHFPRNPIVACGQDQVHVFILIEIP